MFQHNIVIIHFLLATHQKEGAVFTTWPLVSLNTPFYKELIVFYFVFNLYCILQAQIVIFSDLLICINTYSAVQ